MPASEPRRDAPTLTDRGFGTDDGAASPEVTAALAAFAADERAYAGALRALQSGRLLLPVVAVDPGQVPPPGHAHEHHDSDDAEHPDHAHEGDHGGQVMAAVSIQRADGRRGMLAFTGVSSLAGWDAGARPLPVSAQEAADTALRDGAAALVVDICGPVRFVIEGEDLLGVARSWQLGRVGGRSVWIRPAPE